MFSKKHKISSDKPGIILFNDFVLSSYNKFYNENRPKKENIIEIELLIAYTWIIFHFLNIAGKKYEKVATALNHAVFQYYKNNIPSAQFAPLSGDGFFNILNIRFEQYKDAFTTGNKNMNFLGVAMVIADNILVSYKPNIDVFFSFQIGAYLQQSAIDLGNALKKIELVN